MNVSVEIKLVRSSERLEALRGWIESFDPKAFITPIMPDVTGGIFRVKTALTIDQLRNVRGVAQAYCIHENVDVPLTPAPADKLNPGYGL